MTAQPQGVTKSIERELWHSHLTNENITAELVNLYDQHACCLAELQQAHGELSQERKNNEGKVNRLVGMITSQSEAIGKYQEATEQLNQATIQMQDKEEKIKDLEATISNLEKRNAQLQHAPKDLEVLSELNGGSVIVARPPNGTRPKTYLSIPRPSAGNPSSLAIQKSLDTRAKVVTQVKTFNLNTCALYSTVKDNSLEDLFLQNHNKLVLKQALSGVFTDFF